jgi:hypothetical protein
LCRCIVLPFSWVICNCKLLGFLVTQSVHFCYPRSCLRSNRHIPSAHTNPIIDIEELMSCTHTNNVCVFVFAQTHTITDTEAEQKLFICLYVCGCVCPATPPTSAACG